MHERRRTWWLMMAAALVVALGLVGSSAVLAATDFPRRPIYISVYSAAGGATDLSNRAVAAAMEKELGTSITILNMPGAQGGVGAAYVWNAAHDGYVWFGLSEGALGLAVLGAHPTTSKDWEYFLVGGMPGVISVRKDSPYKTLEDLVAAVRAKPGTVKLASSIPGCVWHIQFLTMQRDTGMKFKWVPYPGSYPSQVAALSGEIDVVLTGLGEQAEFLKSGQLRPLAVFDKELFTADKIGKLRPVTEVLPELAGSLPIRQFVGFGVPKDTPKEVLDKIDAAFQKAMKAEPVVKYGQTTYSTLYGLSRDAARPMVEKQERLFAWLLYEAGIATHSPEQFGIARP